MEISLELPTEQFVSECKQAVYSFYWMLLPSFSSYLYTLLGNVCLFNNVEYITNEISEEYRSFYTHLLSTQVSSSLINEYRVLLCSQIISGVLSILSLLLL